MSLAHIHIPIAFLFDGEVIEDKISGLLYFKGVTSSSSDLVKGEF